MATAVELEEELELEDELEDELEEELDEDEADTLPLDVVTELIDELSGSSDSSCVSSFDDFPLIV
jgi:hypothetical protein